MLHVSLLLASMAATLTTLPVHAMNMSLVVSGPRHLAADDTCEISLSPTLVTTDLTSVAASTVTDCCPLCGQTAGCVGFIWTDWNGGTCWLKSSISDILASTNTVWMGRNSASHSPGASCAIEHSVDYVGNDIGSIGGATVFDCCARCRAWSGCNAFSWNDANGGTCYLKSGRGKTIASDTVHSGVVHQQSQCGQREANTDYTGNDIGNAPAESADICCNKCASTDGCGAFTWNNYQGGTCWFKSRKVGTTSSFGSISAVVTSPSTKCPNIETGVDYRGNDIASVRGAATECCTKCGQQNGCGAFTWTNFNGGTCWLKSGKGATQASSGSISAVYRR